MTGTKAPKKTKDFTGQPAYEQGRAAYRGAISIGEAPYGEDDANLEAWTAGYKFEKAALGQDGEDERG